MKTQKIFKAQPSGAEAVPGVTIEILEEFPEKQNPDWRRYAEVFDEQAELLENTLHDSLPGGTYDRLLGRMLARKASHFVVPHG